MERLNVITDYIIVCLVLLTCRPLLVSDKNKSYLGICIALWPIVIGGIWLIAIWTLTFDFLTKIKRDYNA